MLNLILISIGSLFSLVRLLLFRGKVEGVLGLGLSVFVSRPSKLVGLNELTRLRSAVYSCFGKTSQHFVLNVVQARVEVTVFQFQLN